MSKLIFFIIWLFPLRLFGQPAVEFLSENIDFTINAKTFCVNGIYTFVNNTDTDLNQNVIFPVQDNIDSLAINRVYNLSYNRSIDFWKSPGGLVFKIFLYPRDTVFINLSYCQETQKENIYILSSTRSWSNAMKTANYSLVSDNSVIIDSFSYQYDTLLNNVYYWNMKDFYPEKEFRVWINEDDN